MKRRILKSPQGELDGIQNKKKEGDIFIVPRKNVSLVPSSTGGPFIDEKEPIPGSMNGI